MISRHCSIWNALARAVLLSCTYTLSFPGHVLFLLHVLCLSLALARADSLSSTYSLFPLCTLCLSLLHVLSPSLVHALSISCTYTYCLTLLHLVHVHFSSMCSVYLLHLQLLSQRATSFPCVYSCSFSLLHVLSFPLARISLSLLHLHVLSFSHARALSRSPISLLLSIFSSFKQPSSLLK
jgi:hypothetical protein